MVDGGRVITQSTSPYDSSATALLTYFLQRCKEEGFATAEQIDEPIRRAIASLQQHTRIDGTVDFAQGVCRGPDRMSPYYGPAPYVQGPVLAVMSKAFQSEPQPRVRESRYHLSPFSSITSAQVASHAIATSQ